jgi:predicted nucleic-acid-binding Zn-ribbon protein
MDFGTYAVRRERWAALICENCGHVRGVHEIDGYTHESKCSKCNCAHFQETSNHEQVQDAAAGGN